MQCGRRTFDAFSEWNSFGMAWTVSNGGFTWYDFVSSDKLTTGLRLRTIYTRTTFSPCDIQKFACNCTPKEYSLCGQLNSTSSSLQREINFSVSSSENLFLICRLWRSVWLEQLRPTFWSKKTSPSSPASGNLSQNRSISIDFGYDCRRVLKHVLKSYGIFCDVHDSRRRVVGLIDPKQFV